MAAQKKPESIDDTDLDAAQGGSAPTATGWWNPDVASELKKTGASTTELDARKKRPRGVQDTISTGN